MTTITHAEAREQTARLIAECPDWCTVSHDSPDVHPQDVRHSRAVGMTSVGEVFVVVYPVAIDDEPQASIWVNSAEADDTDLTYDDAMNTASVMIQAATALKVADEWASA